MNTPRSNAVTTIKKSHCPTQERILEAALKLFSQKGFLGATTREIAAAANVSEPTLFRYFSSKDRLLDAVISTSAFFPAMEDVLFKAFEMPHEKALEMLAEQFLQIFSSRKDLIRIMKWEIHRNPRVGRMYYSMLNGLIKTCACYFREMQLRGQLVDFNSKSMALAFMGILMFFFDKELRGGCYTYKRTGRAASITDCVRIFLRGTLVSDIVKTGRSKKGSVL